MDDEGLLRLLAAIILRWKLDARCSTVLQHQLADFLDMPVARVVTLLPPQRRQRMEERREQQSGQ